MMGRIHADIFFQERYMPNEVGVKIKLVRSKDAFCLMRDDDYMCYMLIHITRYLLERVNSVRTKDSLSIVKTTKMDTPYMPLI